jgi:hypothetical protein
VDTGFWWGNLKERDYFGDPGAAGRITFRGIFRKWDVGGYGLDQAGSGQGQMVGTCECSNEPSGCIKFGEFLG